MVIETNAKIIVKEDTIVTLETIIGKFFTWKNIINQRKHQSVWYFVKKKRNNRRYGGRNSDRQERGDYNNYSRNNRREDQQNGENYNNFERRGGDEGQRGYRQQRNADRSDPTIRTNDRWQESDQHDNPQPGNNQRTIPKGDNIDYTALMPRNERLEQELFGTSSTGINFNKYEDIPVEATGSQVPPNINTFDDIKLTPIIQANIVNACYDKPTPVQKYAIPIICSGRDLMACAQTG